MIEAEKAKKMEGLIRTLRGSGLAASSKDAAELAEKMLSGKISEEAVKPEEVKSEAGREIEEEVEGSIKEPEAEEIKAEEVVKEKAEKQTELTDVRERIPTVDELEEMPRPEKGRDAPDYDITKESKTLKELMDEDAEKIYEKEKKGENA